MWGFLQKIMRQLFGGKKDISLGIYGPPNVGKTTLANRISMDLTGEEMGEVSEIPHETRHVLKKENVFLEAGGRSINMNLLDMPGISTKVDYRDFKKFGLKATEAKDRAKEATKGIIEAIKFLDDVDACLVVLDSTKDPYTQVNITIIGNLEAKEIPIIIIANKIDLKRAKPDRVAQAFPQHPVIEISAQEGLNIDELYELIAETVPN